MAVGIAVLVSMLFAPHERYWQQLNGWFWTRYSDAERRVLAEQPEYIRMGYVPAGYVPSWCEEWRWFPIFWIEDGNPILWANLAGQTVFVAVLAAIAANVRWRRTK